MNANKILLLSLLVALAVPAPAYAEEIVIPSDVIEIAEEVGKDYCICPEVLEAIAWRESRCNDLATNGQYKGMMQIGTRTHHARIEKCNADVTDTEDAMRLACDLLFEYKGDDEELFNALVRYSGGSSQYALSVLQMSEMLERAHGK